MPFPELFILLTVKSLLWTTVVFF